MRKELEEKLQGMRSFLRAALVEQERRALLNQWRIRATFNNMLCDIIGY